MCPSFSKFDYVDKCEENIIFSSYLFEFFAPFFCAYFSVHSSFFVNVGLLPQVFKTGDFQCGCLIGSCGFYLLSTLQLRYS